MLGLEWGRNRLLGYQREKGMGWAWGLAESPLTSPVAAELQ